jgi:hypothetical protein
MLLDGPQPVFRAARVEAATRHEEFRQRELIPPDEDDEQPLQDPAQGVRPKPVEFAEGRHHCAADTTHRESFVAALASAETSSSPSKRLDAVAAGGSARTTTVLPLGSAPSRPRICDRRRRATRWRTTEPPTPLPTDSPTRVNSAEFAGGGITWMTRHDLDTRMPRRDTDWKSVDLRSRFSLASMAWSRT